LRTPNSTYTELKRADGTGIRFSFGKTTWVGLWSRTKAGLPYICIEPWHGVDDPIDATGKLTEKQDIVHLPAGETFEMHLCISPF
ncbi:MAG: aldose 1-epimerase family protein, partial [Clostridia bacterium]|nr:aldose 1-epimerase family protein [Clostridia bacterium]